jgi:hypothetical protein
LGYKQSTLIARTLGFKILSELLGLTLSNESGEVELEVSGPNGFFQRFSVKIEKDSSTGNLIVYISNVDPEFQAGEYNWEVVKVTASDGSILEIISAGAKGTFEVNEGKFKGCSL